MAAQDEVLTAWPAPLAGRLAEGADAGQIADFAVSIWMAIDQALHPVIGHRGVAALYSRSLSLTAARQPWLAESQPGALGAVDPSAMKATLLRQDAAQAAAGGDALFQSFQALLASLVGASLTHRLLRPVWANFHGLSPAQDTR